MACADTAAHVAGQGPGRRQTGVQVGDNLGRLAAGSVQVLRSPGRVGSAYKNRPIRILDGSGLIEWPDAGRGGSDVEQFRDRLEVAGVRSLEVFLVGSGFSVPHCEHVGTATYSACPTSAVNSRRGRLRLRWTLRRSSRPRSSGHDRAIRHSGSSGSPASRLVHTRKEWQPERPRHCLPPEEETSKDLAAPLSDRSTSRRRGCCPRPRPCR